MTQDLPPMPDPQTGQPRPPHAPVDGQNREPTAKQPFRARKVLAGSEGGGPTLEWHYGDRKMQRWMAVGLAVVLIAFYTIRSEGLAWVTVWYLWAYVAVIMGLGWLLPLGHKIAAGADWLNTRGGIVKTYELTEITVRGTAAGGYNIELRDQNGGEADTSLSFLCENRDLWDLVYNGIRHSIAAGAATTALTRRKLRLDSSGAVQEPAE